MKNHFIVKVDDTTEIVQIWRSGHLIHMMGYKEFQHMFESMQPVYSFVHSATSMVKEELEKWEDADRWE